MCVRMCARIYVEIGVASVRVRACVRVRVCVCGEREREREREGEVTDSMMSPEAFSYLGNQAGPVSWQQHHARTRA